MYSIHYIIIDQGNALWNLLMGLLDKSVVPLSFLMRDVSNKNRLLKCIIRIVDKRFYF